MRTTVLSIGLITAPLLALGLLADREALPQTKTDTGLSQKLGSFPLPDALRAHVKDEHFGIVTSIKGLPLGVREALQTLFGSQTLDIVEPGADIQMMDATGTPNPPIRRMVTAGCSGDHHCVVYYERFGSAHSWHVALFRWEPASTRFEWGGLAPGGLTSIEEVRDAMLSGSIKGPSKDW